MNRRGHKGHALTTTLLVIVLFAFLSTATLHNALLESRMVSSHTKQIHQQRRADSAMRYLESNVIPDLLASDRGSHSITSAPIVIEIPLNLHIEDRVGTGTLPDPVATIRPLPGPVSLVNGRGSGIDNIDMPILEVALTIEGNGEVAALRQTARFIGVAQTE